MHGLETRLSTWVARGLLDAEQASAIAAFERARTTQDAVGSSGSGAGSQRSGPRGVLAEALGYVGASLALGAAAAMLAQVWDQLTVGGRVALALVLTVVLFGAAAALRSGSSPALLRLSAALGGAGALAAAWTSGLLAAEVAMVRPELVALTVGCTALLGGAGVQAARPSVPAQLVTLAGAIATVVAVLQLPRLAPDLFWSGLLVWAVGIGWVLLARGSWVQPGRAGEVLGAAVALVAGLVAAVGDRPVAGLALVVVTAAALVWAAVVLEGPHLLVLGALGFFVGVPRLVFELFGDTIGAPALLLVVGLLLVLAAVAVGRIGRDVRSRGRGGAGR